MGKQRIVIADDCREVREGLSGLLIDIGFEVDCVPDGRELVQVVSGGNYKGVITDINMPVIDGLEATEQLREQRYRGVIIVYSMDNEIELVKAAKRAGADDYFYKGDDSDILIEMLREHLCKKQKIKS